MMIAFEQYRQRHLDIKKKLNEISQIKIGKGRTMEVCRIVGVSLEVSAPTVHNYISGKISDGYLAEAIYQEFKKMKSPK